MGSDRGEDSPAHKEGGPASPTPAPATTSAPTFAHPNTDPSITVTQSCFSSNNGEAKLSDVAPQQGTLTVTDSSVSKGPDALPSKTASTRGPTTRFCGLLASVAETLKLEDSGDPRSNHSAASEQDDIETGCVTRLSSPTQLLAGDDVSSQAAPCAISTAATTFSSAVRRVAPSPGQSNTDTTATAAVAAAAAPSNTLPSKANRTKKKKKTGKGEGGQQRPPSTLCPIQGPQAYPPLSCLPRLQLMPFDKFTMLELADREPMDATYPLPFKGKDGRQALAAIPGLFLPGHPRPGVFGQPATLTERMYKFSKSHWLNRLEYGWARRPDLSAGAVDPRPPPIPARPNMSDDEVESIPTPAVLFERITFVPEWASDYPFPMLYEAGTGFAFPLFDIQERPALPTWPNYRKAHYMGWAPCPYDPFDIPCPDPRQQKIDWGQHPARIDRLNEQIELAQKRAR
ncbi:hypothetical protein BDZ90DRAFT_40549 [Jaminaea rosea]|uniref:Uncharacterized protein n=1 Tax=Jaminaea rosea TaxID=1569628 RepID=A0A316UMK3_9BASI|nr:hypothetical protein BDZ90DRAFT_40549 [Jaminaea rosea]PWN26522.1 hypothetical protein BDZ90DRAFT_40549 [Jaminaea rosea]